MWYGTNDLTAYHALCHAIAVEPRPQTCEPCEELRASCTVQESEDHADSDPANIVDLIEWERRRGNEESPDLSQACKRVFSSTVCKGRRCKS